MRYTIYAFLLFLAVFPSRALGQWQPDGIILSNIYPSNDAVQLIPTESGGAILVWATCDIDDTSWDIFAQKVDGAGYLQWSPGGVPVCIAPRAQAFPLIASDGLGGVLIAWYDSRRDISKRDIYVQRLSSTGVPMWTSNGVLICDVSNSTSDPAVTSDGAGGAIVVWTDRRGYLDIFAQRVDALGAPMWATNGIAVCPIPKHKVDQMIVADGSGGAIIVWVDSRNNNNGDIYAQRLDPSGTGLWGLDGIPICTAPGTQDPEGFISDGAGGAIASWHDYRSVSADIYAQRVDGLGNMKWTVDGVAVSTNPAVQYSSVIASDDMGGAVIAWRDHRNGNIDIYAQRISDLGSPMWTPDGVALCTAPGDQFLPAISPDAGHGAVVSWNDLRDGEYDVYAQRVDASGIVRWVADGIAVSALDSMETPPHSASDGAGGAIFGWSDDRSGTRQAYARRVNEDGHASTPVGDAPLALGLSIAPGYPNPFSSSTSFVVDLPIASAVQFDVFDVTGRRVRSAHAQHEAVGSRELTFDGRDDTGRLLPSGVYFYRVKAAGQTITRKMVIAR